jgi:hypothetical protein
VAAGSSKATELAGVGPALDGRLADVPHLSYFTSRKCSRDGHASLEIDEAIVAHSSFRGKPSIG